MARIVLWSRVQPGQVVLHRDRLARVDVIEGPAGDEMLVHLTIQPAGVQRIARLRGSSLVPVLMSAEDKSQIVDFIRSVFRGA